MKEELRKQLYAHFRGADRLREYYERLDAQINQTANHYNLHCKQNCGACCMGHAESKEATPFEMLPLAIELEVTGKADQYLERLENEDCADITCVGFVNVDESKGWGHCGVYTLRPFVCRLFGDSLYHTKGDQTEYTGCKWLKEQYEKNPHKKELHDELPGMAETAMEGRDIDEEEEEFGEIMDINDALKTALEQVRMKHHLLEGKLE